MIFVSVFYDEVSCIRDDFWCVKDWDFFVVEIIIEDKLNWFVGVVRLEVD